MYKFRSKTLKVLFSTLLACTLIVGSIFSASLPASAADPIKIMPVGDSCTDGMGGGNMGSYRTVLYKLLKDAGINFDFVGERQGGPSTLPDRDHNGNSGWTIPQVAQNIDNWMSAKNPDVILLWIGGNDAVWAGGDLGNNLRNLIDQIFRKDPKVTLFVADYYPWPDSVLKYNAMIPGIVQEKATGGRNLHFVKLSEINWNKSTDLSGDNLHLTEGGYTKIANIWYKYIIDELKALQGGTSPTSTPTNKPTNTPTNKPTNTPTNKPTNTPTTAVVREDINGDKAINMQDVMLVAAHFNTTTSSSNYDKKCDINNDGAINMNDVMLIAAKFNTTYK